MEVGYQPIWELLAAVEPAAQSAASLLIGLPAIAELTQMACRAAGNVRGREWVALPQLGTKRALNTCKFILNIVYIIENKAALFH